MPARTATTTNPLPLKERRELVEKVRRTATGKAAAGLALIDFREPTPAERAHAASLEGRAQRALSKSSRPRKAA